MKYLLDTHIYLWWLNNDYKKISNQVRDILENPKNVVLVSIITFWEIGIKIRSRKLKLKTSFNKLFDELQFNLLDLNTSHVLDCQKLPLYHQDPFDRMLVAQAKVEKCTLITADPKIKQYKLHTLP